MKRIIVTGATGLIGSSLVKKLLMNLEYEVVAVSRSERKLRTVFAEQLQNKRFNYYEHDFCKPMNWDILFKDGNKVKFVYHAAGPISSEVIKIEPLSVIRPNVNALQEIFEYVYQNKINCRVIVFSSATIYGNILAKDIIVDELDTAVTEKITSFNTPYSESKRMSEVITRAYINQCNIDAVIVRPSFVYGYSFFSPKTAFYSFVENIKNGKNIIINKTGLERRDNIYISDAVDGLICVAEKGDVGESYNISSNGDGGGFAAIDEIAQLLVSNKRNKYSQLEYFEKEKKERKPGIILCNTKLKKLGWEIKYSLQDGLDKSLSDYIDIG